MDDASKIYRELYQGGVPPVGGWLEHRGFDVLVLTAEEYQPAAAAFPGLEVVHFPLADDAEPWSPRRLRALRRLTVWLARQVRAGRRVLVTCQQGLNRSGLIVAATVMQLSGAPAFEAVALIRARRSGWALCNDTFVDLLKGPVSQWAM